MARYNTVASVGSTAAAGTISTPNSGLFTTFTGTAPYTVTVPNPILYAGQQQVFYNTTSGVITLSSPSGIFGGPGSSGITTQTMPANSTLTLYSDGTNYITAFDGGSTLVATTGTFNDTLTANGAVNFNPNNATITISPTGTGTLTVNPSTTGNINNVNVGATTKATGGFTTLTANSTVTFTANTASSGTGSGTLQVTGGVGVTGAIFSGSMTAGSGTVNGILQLIDPAAAASSTQVLQIKNSTNYIGMLANATSGAANPLVVAGDQTIIFSGGTQTTTGNLVIGPWSTNGYGLRLSNTGTHSMGGSLLPSANNSYDLGASGTAWRHIYTNDLHLSNGIGDYTVVEGEENLYIINNKSGKSYKFMLAEVPASEVPPRQPTV